LIEITFVRHAETTANATGTWQGHGDAGLSGRGRRQAHALGDRLSGRQFDVVVSSDLDRALETAVLAGLDPRSDARWREIDIGRWEGLTRAEVHERYPEEISRIEAGEAVRLGGGESWLDLAARVERSLGELVGEVPDGSRVLVLSHGGVIHAALEAGFSMVGHELSGDGSRGLGQLRNASVTEVGAEAGSFRVRVFNDVTHLDGDRDAGPSIALIRHGESEANVAGRWHGRTDGPLSERGRSQAAMLGARHPAVARVFASPLERARETAAALAGSLGLSIEIRPDLVEIDFGAWEGLTFAEITERHPEEWREVFEHGQDIPRGGTGETFAGAGARLAAAIAEIARRHSGEEVALVSHGGLIWAAAARILGIGWRSWRLLAIPANASASHVRVDDGHVTLVDFNTGGDLP
jgi:broad specificity phosphatase PhoE